MPRYSSETSPHWILLLPMAAFQPLGFFAPSSGPSLLSSLPSIYLPFLPFHQTPEAFILGFLEDPNRCTVFLTKVLSILEDEGTYRQAESGLFPYYWQRPSIYLLWAYASILLSPWVRQTPHTPCDGSARLVGLPPRAPGGAVNLYPCWQAYPKRRRAELSGACTIFSPSTLIRWVTLSQVQKYLASGASSPGPVLPIFFSWSFLQRFSCLRFYSFSLSLFETKYRST